MNTYKYEPSNWPRSSLGKYEILDPATNSWEQYDFRRDAWQVGSSYDPPFSNSNITSLRVTAAIVEVL